MEYREKDIELLEITEMYKMLIQDDIEENNKYLLKLDRQNLQEIRKQKRNQSKGVCDLA